MDALDEILSWPWARTDPWALIANALPPDLWRIVFGFLEPAARDLLWWNPTHFSRVIIRPARTIEVVALTRRLKDALGAPIGEETAYFYTLEEASLFYRKFLKRDLAEILGDRCQVIAVGRGITMDLSGKLVLKLNDMVTVQVNAGILEILDGQRLAAFMKSTSENPVIKEVKRYLLGRIAGSMPAWRKTTGRPGPTPFNITIIGNGWPSDVPLCELLLPFPDLADMQGTWGPKD